MKTKATAIPHLRKTLGAVLAAGLLMAAAGCIHVAINVVSPPSQGDGTASPPVDKDQKVVGGPEVVGGNFVPTYAPRSVSASGGMVCQKPVSQYYVRFSNPSAYLWQTSPPTAIGFSGRVVNTNTGAIIPNTSYHLQCYVDVGNKECATNVTGSSTQIGFVVQPGTIYRFTAYFKNNVQLPPSGHQVQLQGSWIEQP